MSCHAVLSSCVYIGFWTVNSMAPWKFMPYNRKMHEIFLMSNDFIRLHKGGFNGPRQRLQQVGIKRRRPVIFPSRSFNVECDVSDAGLCFTLNSLTWNLCGGCWNKSHENSKSEGIRNLNLLYDICEACL